MKNLIYILISLVSISLMNCGKDDEGTVDNDTLVKQELAGQWTPTYVSLDGNDITADFTGFTITIDPSLSYSANSSELDRQPNPWPSSGIFTLMTPVENTALAELTRNDGLVVEVNISGDIIELSFSFDDSHAGSNGRTVATTGEWVFRMAQ